MNGKGEWKSTKKNPFELISRGSLTKEAKVWFYFRASVLLPSKYLSTVRQEEATLLYAILKGYKINYELLQQQVQRPDSSPNNNYEVVHPRRGERNLGRRRKV